jgi:hypothetical protein
MPLVPLDIPAGVARGGTDLQSAGRWRDASLVRWADGTMQPVGGWATRVAGTLNAACRGALAWSDNSGDRRIAFGTFSKLYSLSASGTLSDITPVGFSAGAEDAVANLGYGGGFYGADAYGTPRSDTGSLSDPTTWSLDTWGEYLIAATPDDGKIYEWQLDTGVLPAAVTNAPTSVSGAFVTDERFLVALGAGGDPRKVQWSDREDNTTWTPAVTNEAGDFELKSAGTLKKAIRCRGQALLLSTLDAHTMTYVGPPFVYSFERVGESCGVIGPKAAVAVDGGAFWMGRRSFYSFFGGGVEELPCEVADYVFTNLNTSQAGKVYAVNNAQFGEVWWFYPSTASNECNSYVAHNYRTGIWMIGTIDRCAGVDRGVFSTPIWVSAAGAIYNHEIGNLYDSGDVYAESGPISFGAGDSVMVATSLIPDEKTQGQCTVTFKTRFHPNDTEREYGSYSMAAPTDVRFTGRQVRMRVTGAEGVSWRWGIPRLEARPGGRR